MRPIGQAFHPSPMYPGSSPTSSFTGEPMTLYAQGRVTPPFRGPLFALSSPDVPAPLALGFLSLVVFSWSFFPPPSPPPPPPPPPPRSRTCDMKCPPSRTTQKRFPPLTPSVLIQSAADMLYRTQTSCLGTSTQILLCARQGPLLNGPLTLPFWPLHCFPPIAVSFLLVFLFSFYRYATLVYTHAFVRITWIKFFFWNFLQT